MMENSALDLFAFLIAYFVVTGTLRDTPHTVNSRFSKSRLFRVLFCLSQCLCWQQQAVKTFLHLIWEAGFW